MWTACVLILNQDVGLVAGGVRAKEKSGCPADDSFLIARSTFTSSSAFPFTCLTISSSTSPVCFPSAPDSPAPPDSSLPLVQVLKTLIIVVALFAFCWLPLQSYTLLQDFFPQINE